jgi:sugar phosphate isomerase/epimerase
VEFVHFKDYCIAPDGSETLVPVGQGVTDWSAAVDACRETGVRWAFAEQERWEKDAFPVYAGEPGRHARLGL